MKIHKIFLTLSAVLASVLSYGQDMMTVTGTVTDSSNGLPVPFASIQLKGTMTGANTDGDGKYSMDIPSDGVLIFSSIGYKTVEVPLTGAAVLDVVLNPDTEMLEETIVVAYGTATRSSFTGSASAVDSDKGREGRRECDGSPFGTDVRRAGDTVERKAGLRRDHPYPWYGIHIGFQQSSLYT